ncbi:GNAT family N-acetyltransferase [Actinosynnema sp. NPDC023587]|uniref:GNAT family N-acetyltransferase n=1 Tax=Actinosynnema sp. NPDC023587 TaxID=3154695 RepID=UPI0033F12EA0
MNTDGWHFTGDVEDFLTGGGAFLRSRPAEHTTPLTVVEKLRTAGGADATVFGRLVRAGEVDAVLHLRPAHRLGVTRLSAEQADALAAELVGRGHTVPGIVADHDTATAFAEAWRRYTGAATAPRLRVRLHRLGALTPLERVVVGRTRVAGERDHQQVVRWCGEFLDDIGEVPANSWADSRFADKVFTFWETPDGTPVAMAATTPMVAGMVRVDPVHTRSRFRGRGYGGAVTAEVSRAALAAGATDVVLYTDPANPTSNALYRRIGYVPIADFTGYDFSSTSNA